MNSRTEAFLRDYLKLLESVQTVEQAYRLLPAWQSARLPEWQAVCQDLNAELGLAGDLELRSHIPTTFVGRLDGIVIAAANPGFGDLHNQKEHEYRSVSKEQNREFLTRFFERYPIVTGCEVRNGFKPHRSPFWNRVLRHCAKAFDTTAPPRSCQELWARAQDGYPAIGGLDIIPFHSRKDGVTPLLLGAPATAAARLLREMALQSLRMVAQRLQPQLLFIASATGYDLFEDLRLEVGFPRKLRVAQERYGLWCHGSVYQSDQSRTQVLSVRWQLFAGGAAPPKGRSPARLPSLTRDVHEGRVPLCMEP